MTVRIITGDCRDVLATMPAESVHCVVTSPPYWGLRDYGVAGQIGLESTYQEFVEQMVAVFREVRRVLRADGTCWVNLGDSYATGMFTRQGKPRNVPQPPNDWYGTDLGGRRRADHVALVERHQLDGLKPKDLCGIPWRVAFALQADGWWLRQDIIWSKPNPMPESVTDRCTKAHEYVFLLSKSERYYFDQESLREPFVGKALTDLDGGAQRNRDGSNANGGRNYNVKRTSYRPGSASNMNGGEHVKKSDAGLPVNLAGRNKRSVWEVATQPFSEAHFATFPPALIEPCILAGCPKGGTVLDPFFGAGTTGLVADRLQRDCIGIELNPAYADMARKRCEGDAPLFYQAAE